VPSRERVPVREGVRGKFQFRIPAGFLAEVPAGRRARMMPWICGQALVRARVHGQAVAWHVGWLPVVVLAGVVAL
jgi:hypothetical protein